MDKSPLAGFVLFLLFCFYVTWGVRDARRRGKSPLLVGVLLVLFFPIGWIGWLVARPKPVRKLPPPFFRLWG